MIYLIESGNYYKIGYAENLENRLKAYDTHNPEYKLIDTMNGDKYYETLLHHLCKDYNEKFEWFTKCDEILILWNNFKNIISDIEKLTQKIEKCEETINNLNKKLIEKYSHTDELLLTNLLNYASKSELDVINVLRLYSIDNKITLDSQIKNFIINKTGLKEGTIKNTMAALVKKDMLLKDENYKGIYYLNPKYFFKGRINDRTQIIDKVVQYQIANQSDNFLENKGSV